MGEASRSRRPKKVHLKRGGGKKIAKPFKMQPETITAIAGGVVTVLLAAARVAAQYVRSRRGRKGAWKRVREVQHELGARRMADARGASDASAACAHAVDAVVASQGKRSKHVTLRADPEICAIAGAYEELLRRTPRAKLAPTLRGTLPLYYAAVYHAATNGGSAAIDTFRSAARRLHLPDAVLVLARVGGAHVPVRIEPRGGLRPLVEGTPLEEQLCDEHQEENALAIAAIRDWTSNEHAPVAVTVHPAYATGMTMHLLRADEGACVVCVASEAHASAGPVLRALYKNEATFVLRVDASGHIAAVCATAHAAAHVADVHLARVRGLLSESEAGHAWRGRECRASTMHASTDHFIFVVLG